MEGLRVAVRIAIYEHIAKRESHRWSYANWCDARNLGVALPEATPLLQAWQPAQADRNSDLPRQSNVLVGEPLLVGAFGPAIEQCAAFALAKDARFIGRLADMDPPMEGYGWYDALPRITAMMSEPAADWPLPMITGARRTFCVKPAKGAGQAVARGRMVALDRTALMRQP